MDISLISLGNEVECYLFCPKSTEANFVPKIVPLVKNELKKPKKKIEEAKIVRSHQKRFKQPLSKTNMLYLDEENYRVLRNNVL